MKKLLTLMIMLGVFLIPRYTTQAALTPPTTYDYSYTYNGTTFEFSDGTNTYIPEFTQTSNPSGGNDYEYIGDMNGLAPFEITLKFVKSTTSWTFNTTDYIPTSSFIGANLTYGAIYQRWYININNINANQYLLWIDESDSTPASTNAYIDVLYNNTFNITYDTFSANYIRSATNRYKSIYLPVGINTTIYNTAGTIERYLSAFYLQDLGVSPTVSNTIIYQNGYENGFGEGYLQGVQEDNAYALGYARGLSEGADMETGSSILIFVVAGIGFIMMIFGFTTKRGIFNLLSVGAFVVLGAMLSAYIGFIIIAIGLVIVNVYYAFWGDL